MILSLCVVALAASAQSAASLPQSQSVSRRSGPLELGNNGNEDSRPWFCHEQECPHFEVVKNASSYQVREYDSGQNWVLTKVSGLLYASAVSTGFKRIYQYTDGANDKEIKVPMSTPVVTNIKPSGSAFKRSNYTVGIWLPNEFQKDAPKPSADDVYLKTLPSGKVVYVLEFGGLLVDDLTVNMHMNKLKQALLEDRLEFDESSYFTATYDEATRVTGRHNEVWFVGSKDAATQHGAMRQ